MSVLEPKEKDALGERIRRRIRSFPVDCVALATVGACASATVEAVLTTVAVPFAISDTRGLVLFWLGSVAYFGPACLVAATATFAVCRGKQRWLSWTTPLAMAVVSALVVAAALVHVRNLIVDRDLQFLEKAADLETGLTIMMVIGGVLLHHHVTGWLRKRPAVDKSQRRLLGVLLLLAGLLAMVGSATHLMALHLLEAATIAGTFGACLLTISAVLLLPWPLGRAGWALSTLLVASWFVLPVQGPAADHASFLRYAHAPISGGLAALLRHVADTDGHRAAPWFLGETDGQKGHSSLGSLHETPDDGIDALPGPFRDHQPETIADCRSPTEPLSVLLITIDAMRAEMLRPNLTPSLLQLARHSIVFSRVYSPSTMTNASMAAIFFGLPYSKSMAAPRLRGQSIVTSLREAGLETVAFNRLALDPALTAGFAEVNPVPVDVRHELDSRPLHSVAQSRAVLSWLDTGDSQRFVWVHYGDAHAPYRVPPIVSGIPSGYPAAFRYIDLQIGYLLGELSERGLLGKYVVAVTSDHGEDLGQRMREGHGPNLYEESIRVPLILWVPGCRPRVETSSVSLIHLMPTLAQLAGVTVKKPGLWEAIRLGLPVVAEEGADRTYTFKRAIIMGQWKLLVDARSGGRVLFDLANDSLERTNAYRKNPDAARQMEAAYEAWMGHVSGARVE